ncbi:MAG: SPFH domain-containing protein, partial [Elusimicrobiota bacterium]
MARNQDDDEFAEFLERITASVASKGGRMIGNFFGKLFGAAMVLAALVVFFGCYFIVAPGEVAVKTRLGRIVDSYDEGMHFKVPLMESITKFSIQIQRVDIKTQAFSKDLQTMNTHLVVNHRIQKGTVISIFRNLGPHYVNAVVDSTVQEIFKS